MEKLGPAKLVNSSSRTSTPFSAKTFLHLFLQRLTLTTSRMSFLITSLKKIRTIRNNYFPPPNPTACPGTYFTGNPLLTIEPVTDEFVLKIINSAPANSCELEPIPTTLLYENLDIRLPTITNIINKFLTTGIVTRDLKTAIVKPLLKKPSLEQNLFKNFRPISNLPFL